MNLKTISLSIAATAIAGSLALIAPTAQAGTFTNGSFEDGALTNPFSTVLGGDPTSITGWTVTGQSIDYIGNYWQAADGDRSLDLNGSDSSGMAQGGIQQTFDTIANQTYKVLFSIAGNPDGAPSTKVLSAIASGGISQLFALDTTGFSRTNMGWREVSYLFTAASNSTTLSFASDIPGQFGPALDNVSVTATAVPTPALLPGLIAMGVGMMRKRKAEAKADA